MASVGPEVIGGIGSHPAGAWGVGEPDCFGRPRVDGDHLIYPSNWVRIMVATKPIHSRKGHDGLAALVKNALHEDMFTGTVFVLRARRPIG